MSAIRFLGPAFLILLTSARIATAQTPTADQMEIFRNLPPEDQQAVLEGLSKDSNDGVKRDKGVTSPETVRPRDTRDTKAKPGADTYGIYADEVEREPRIVGGDTVMLALKLKPSAAATRSIAELKLLQSIVERALKSNPYRLDKSGVLRLSGLEPIPLAGLTEVQATARLAGDPSLRDVDAKVTLLPLERLDADALQPFGYDLFAGVPSTFAPATDVPVPAQYVMGPGDRLEVQLLGNTKGRYSLVVNRDGRVMFPDLGPINLSGLAFTDAKAQIESRVAERMIGTQAVVSMGDLRSIRIFVLGEAERPGSYTVSGLSTVTNALFASGGVKPIGSLRNIQLKRSGVVVQRLDLYDLLLNGDTSGDVRLLPGDVIFIPPVGAQAGVTGEIRRPAIYELKGEATASDLLYLAGGLLPEGDPALAKLERINEQQQRVVLDVDLGAPQGRGLPLRTGDLLRIQAVRSTYSNTVQVEGHVLRPVTQQYRAGLRLADVIGSSDELRPGADQHYVLIRREAPGSHRLQVLSADLQQAWSAPTSDANPLLAPKDRIFVFDLEAGRSRVVKPLLDELALQSLRSEPAQIVEVYGPVRVPGDYPLEAGMRVSDLIRAGGGLGETAFSGDAELARYEIRDGMRRQTDILKIDLARVIAGDPAADIVLQAHDYLAVKQTPQWFSRETVRLEGEVRFPGEYPIKRGETLRSVLARAGGLTELAFARGSVFTRKDLRERERKQLDVLAMRMRQDLASLALQSSQVSSGNANQARETLAIGQELLADLQNAQPVGRLVVDLDTAMAAVPGDTSDLILKDGDLLRVPKTAQEVTVLGEVQNATSHFYSPGLSRDDYVSRSGGMTQRADRKRTYVVRANGSVVAETSHWFRGEGGMQPGDTVVVPLDAERMRPLPLWTAVTTILFNAAIAVAAVGSL